MQQSFLFSAVIVLASWSIVPEAVAAGYEQGATDPVAPWLPLAVTPPGSNAGQGGSPTQMTPPRKVVMELNGGVIRPHGPMRLWKGFDGQSLFSNTWWGGIGLGFRVSRLAQIDLGMELSAPVIGPDRDSVDERLMRLSFGTWVPRDPSQPLEEPVSDGPVFLMPFGLRVVLPLGTEQVVVGLGGGGAFLLHGEANDRDHPVLGRGCAASCENRYGLGAYDLARLEFIPGGGRIGMGVASRYTRARLSGGKYLPRFGDSRTPDGWVQLGGTLSVRF